MNDGYDAMRAGENIRGGLRRRNDEGLDVELRGASRHRHRGIAWHRRIHRAGLAAQGRAPCRRPAGRQSARLRGEMVAAGVNGSSNRVRHRLLLGRAGLPLSERSREIGPIYIAAVTMPESRPPVSSTQRRSTTSNRSSTNWMAPIMLNVAVLPGTSESWPRPRREHRVRRRQGRRAVRSVVLRE